MPPGPAGQHGMYGKELFSVSGELGVGGSNPPGRANIFKALRGNRRRLALMKTGQANKGQTKAPPERGELGVIWEMSVQRENAAGPFVNP